jgi:hypothetical protein
MVEISLFFFPSSELLKSMSGVPEDILKEIEKFEKKRRSTNGHDVGDYLFDDFDQSVDQRDHDEEMAKYFDEVDAI